MSNRSPSNDPIQWFFHASLLVLFGVIALSVAVHLLESIWMWVVGIALVGGAIAIASSSGGYGAGHGSAHERWQVMTGSRPKRKYRKNDDRIIRVTGVRHDPPDPKRLSHALLALAAELAAAQTEADAQANREEVPSPPAPDEESAP